jgi:hypothetical protein
MLQKSARGRFLEISLFTLSSLVLYHVGNQIGIGVVVFLVPLQVVASRRGAGSLFAVCGLFLLVFLALRLLPFLGGAWQPDILTIVETIFVLSLLFGLLIVNLPLLAPRRALFRLLGATAAAGLGAIPCTIWLSHSAQFQTEMSTLFTEASRMIVSLLSGGQGTADPALSAFLSPDALRSMSGIVLSRSLLALYFGLLSFSWWAGQAFAARSTWPGQQRFRFSGFRLESFWLWPLIGALALILADLFFGSHSSSAWGDSVWQYVAWNVGFVLVILYGLQGLAILRFLFEKHGLPRLLWLILVVTLAILAGSPRSGAFVMVVLPAFGVSENWIRYRIVARREPNES